MQGGSDYCFSHKKKCEWGNCRWRTPESERFCREHTKKCEFEDCPNRIEDSYIKHCPEHPPQEQAKIYKEGRNGERNRANNLQTQLNNANIIITNAQNRLRVNNLGNLPQVPEGETLATLIQRPTQAQFNQVQDERDDYRNRCDGDEEELEQKREIIRQLTREVDAEREENVTHGEMLERRHREQRASDIEKFLKVQTKQRELKLLKNRAKNKLEDAIQKSLIANLLTFQEQITRLSEDTNSRLFSLNERQLQRTKRNLSEKLTEEEINNLCQLQREITELEIKLENLQEQFVAQQEVPPHH
ncbi:MAG: hypothetical protein MRERV_1c013 [Mycoplasmataceae bacterium RV_VA103A]|nr:MAG: hypothetical protein MRERV_1c013 [Mycoplasmataceae bacterium RV_VA103A]